MLDERALRAAGLLGPATIPGTVPERSAPASPASQSAAGGASRQLPSWPGPWHLQVPLEVLTAGMDRRALIHLISSAQASEPVDDPALRAWLRAQSSASPPPSGALDDEDTRRRASAVVKALTMSSAAWGRVAVHPGALWLAVCQQRYGLVVDVFSARWESTLLTSWRHPLAKLARAGWGGATSTASLAVGLEDLPRSVQTYWSGRDLDGVLSPWPPPPQRAGSPPRAAVLTSRQARHQAAALLRQLIADASLLRRQALELSGVQHSAAQGGVRRILQGRQGAELVPMVGEYAFPSAAHAAVMDVAHAVAYQRAGIAAAEAWDLHGDPARRPSVQSLELLAALQRATTGEDGEQ